MTQQLTNAPLEEALIEFRFSPEPAWDKTIYGRVYERIQHQFQKTPRSFQQLNVQFTPLQRTTQIGTEERAVFHHSEHHVLAQVGTHLLAVNNLSPYVGWHNFQPIVTDVYQHYIEVVPAEYLQQVTVQYVNKIVVPLTEAQAIDTLFNVYPAFKLGGLSDFYGFGVELLLPFAEQQAIIQIELRSIPTNQVDKATFLLNISCLSQPVPQDVSHWLEIAHTSIKQVFFSTITSKLKSFFE